MARYEAVSPDLVFDAQSHVQADDLAFKDFGSASIAADASSGRVSPSGGLYDADVAMQRQVGSSGLLSIDFYSRWFDVDTMLVFDRAWRTMYPRDDFVDVVLNGTPDLYGPFWLPTTLIFALFFSSSLSSSIAAYLAGQPYSYDFTRLSVAVSVVYTYAFLLPAGLWAVMRYWAGVDGRSLVDILAVFGYGMTVWIPVALLSIPPLPLLRLFFTIVAFCVSLGFLLRNLYPVLASSPQKAARALVLAIGLVHTVLTFVLYLSFIGVGGPGARSPTRSPVEVLPDPEPIGDEDPQ